METPKIVDLMASFAFALTSGIACLGMALAVHAKIVFPGGELISLMPEKRKRLILTWAKVSLVAQATVLAFVWANAIEVVESDWPFAAGAAAGIFLTIWQLFRIRLLDAIWAFWTYMVFHLMFLWSLGPDWLTR